MTLKMGKKRKRSNIKSKITTTDYLKAVKKADREVQLEQFVGWQRVTKVHKNKKAYDRKLNKKVQADE